MSLMLDYRWAICSFVGFTALLLKFASAQDDNIIGYYYSNCTAKPQFTQGSLYQSNLFNLLSNLTSNSDTKKFYNVSTGENSNKVYGLFLCSSSVENQLCQNCIQSAQNDILQRCPSSKEAIIWYSLCMLRYSNRNIFSINDVSIFYADSGGTAKYSRFNQLLASSFVGLFKVASARCLSLASATTLNVLDGNILMSPAVDCTPDLSSSDCRSCLETGLRRLKTGGHQAGFVLQPSCRLQYSFLDATTLLPSAPNKKLHTGIGIISGFAALLLILIAFLIHRLTKRKAMKRPNGIEEIESMENLQIEYNTIKAATYSFAEANKLGQGGFGIVYMGTLADGQEIAVKRLLSNASGQGIREFKTEACLAAKLQHKNLVKLYGFCLEGDEMLLVYEFVSNKSLDRFLFDAKRGAYLKWETRYKIIFGIARGLLYLHEDSSPKIIHRDLKPSNILLDGEMNPKIADFGLAKLFGGDQTTQGNTSRIGGTFGYMAPEYVATGHFSVKSDIFSYGVILLEIVSGLKNRNSYPSTNQNENLLSYAWRLWKEGDHLNLVDSTLGNQFSKDEAERCILVGLLCTQEDPAKRPKMGSVLIMLNTELDIKLPTPGCPPTFSYKHEISEVLPNTRIAIADVITELSPR